VTELPFFVFRLAFRRGRGHSGEPSPDSEVRGEKLQSHSLCFVSFMKPCSLRLDLCELFLCVSLLFCCLFVVFK
jgi:hypothetical protein